MTSYFISGAQDHASSITQADVEIRIFENSSFSLGYAGFPIHADKSKIVYVEVEGRRSSFILWHVSRTDNKQTKFSSVFGHLPTQYCLLCHTRK